MNKSYPLIIAAAILLLFSSCSSLRIEKRHYRDGFYISYNNKTDRSSEVTPDDARSVTEAEDATITQQVATETNVEALPASSENVTTTDQNVENVAQPELEKQGMEAPAVNSNETTSDQNKVGATTPETPEPHDSDLMLILEVILCFLLPPLAVFLHEGTTKWFWITLILCLCLLFLFTPYKTGSAIWLAAVVIALLAVFDVI